MGEKTTYIMPDQNCTDLTTTMALMNGGSFGANNMWNNPFMYLVWMWMMRWMNNGWGDQNGCVDASTQRQIQTLQDAMHDNHNTDLIMQGINGNADAIREAADKMGCNYNILNQAICGVNSSIQQLGGQLGFSAERVINAVNMGDCNVIQALKDCCCTTQKSILEQGYQNQLANERQTYNITNSINTLGDAMQRGFTTSDFQTQTQTCSLQNTIRDTSATSTNSILAKLDAIQNQSLLDKIDALREKNSEQAVVINNSQQSALFGQMIASATQPINASLAGLTKEVADIQCKLPNTVTLPFSCATAIPTSLAYQGFYNGFGGLYPGTGYFG